MKIIERTNFKTCPFCGCHHQEERIEIDEKQRTISVQRWCSDCGEES